MTETTKSGKPKVPKITVPTIDLKTFLIESMEIDPFWSDVYEEPEKHRK